LILLLLLRELLVTGVGFLFLADFFADRSSPKAYSRGKIAIGE
jgi:hypothetical protein